MNQRQRGSVLSYALIAVLLAALLIGGIIFFKNNSTKLAGNTSPFQPMTEGVNNTSSDDKAKQDQAAQNEAALKQQQVDAEKKAAEQQKAAEQNTTNSQVAANSGTNASGTGMPHTATAPSTLPTTGSEDMFAPAFGAATLIGMTLAYRRSRAAL